MKKQLKELQDLIINKIENEEYELFISEIVNDHFRLTIEIDGFYFSFSIPMDKRYLVQSNNFIKIDNNNEKKLATILFDRHCEPIKKEEIEKQIAKLQKQLNN